MCRAVDERKDVLHVDATHTNSLARSFVGWLRAHRDGLTPRLQRLKTYVCLYLNICICVCVCIYVYTGSVWGGWGVCPSRVALAMACDHNLRISSKENEKVACPTTSSSLGEREGQWVARGVRVSALGV